MLDVSGARKIRSRNPSPGVSKPMSIDEGAESRQQTGCRAGFPRRRGERFWNSVPPHLDVSLCLLCYNLRVVRSTTFRCRAFPYRENTNCCVARFALFSGSRCFFRTFPVRSSLFWNAIERCIDRSLTNVYNTMVRLHDIHDKWPTIIQSSNASE